ncbi:C1D-domain-containing protein [Obba rivulosa]|uniref:Exosome complex protein n=1 Tax=Obba rivulosa TaxID=1052685 RepID=A0A8E2J7V6_9APHY|nr:C1D-domain-containing protein [Obba rivulosa]
MSTDTSKLFPKLELLDGALDDLESQLEPLLAQTLPESVLNLETIQQAKLQVALPYLVYDLVFIYLKTKGIDPKTHPVIAELDRIRQYFDKIKNAESPAKRTMTVDKGAANRFIKNAIAQVREQRPPGDNEGQGPSHIRFNQDGSAPIPVKVTSKMIARAEYQKQLEAVGSEEESELEVIEDADEASDGKVTKKDKGKGRAVDGDAGAPTGARKKRRRPQVDLWAGYGDEQSQKTDDVQAAKKTKSAQGASKEDAIMLDDSGSGRSTPLSADTIAKKEKKAAKKARKKAQKAAAAGAGTSS